MRLWSWGGTLRLKKVIKVTRKQVTFSITESLAEVGKSVASLTKELQNEINDAIKDVAYAAYAHIQSLAQSKLSSTRQDYLKALQFNELGDNTYLIALDSDWANALEDGFAAFNQTPGMMASQKIVEIGRRAGQPWVQHSKATKKNPSHKYAYVPFERHPSTKEPKYADMASQIRAMDAMNKHTQQIQKITEVFKDASGKAIEGLVGIGKSENPFLNDLVKYQSVKVGKGGKESVTSTYINYRCVSEIGKPWIHKGFEGIKAFKDAEAFVDAQIKKIIQTLGG